MLKPMVLCLVVLGACGKKQEQASGAESGSAAKAPAGTPASAETTATKPTEAPAAKPAAPPADLPPRNSAASAEVLAKFDAACDGGYGPACFDSGMRRAQGMGTAKDRVAGAAWMEKGCRLDDAESCSILAGFLALGEQGVAQDKARAVELHAKACPRVPTSCRLLAQYYGRGETVPQDLAKAMSLLDQACKAGDEPACKQAAEHRANGTDK